MTRKATNNGFLESVYLILFKIYISASNYVTTLVVDKVLEAFLAYGRDPGIIFNSSCSNVACMYTEGMSMDYTDCYIASYGNNETNGTVIYLVNVQYYKLERIIQCGPSFFFFFFFFFFCLTER